MRFSDGGEPQGTAGMPTLEVFRKEEVFDVLCVTVRYFGGILLGAGGLTRAYGKTAKLALDAAGIAVMQPHREVFIDCPYSLLETVRKYLPDFEAEETNTEYAASVGIEFFMPSEKFESFKAKIIDVTNGQVTPEGRGEKLFAKKIK